MLLNRTNRDIIVAMNAILLLSIFVVCAWAYKLCVGQGIKETSINNYRRVKFGSLLFATQAVWQRVPVRPIRILAVISSSAATVKYHWSDCWALGSARASPSLLVMSPSHHEAASRISVCPSVRPSSARL